MADEKGRCIPASPLLIGGVARVRAASLSAVPTTDLVVRVLHLLCDGCLLQPGVLTDQIEVVAEGIGVRNLEDLLVSMLSDAFHDIAAEYATAQSADPGVAARAAQERLVAFMSDRRHFLQAALDWQVSYQAHEAVVRAYALGVEAAIESVGDAAPAHADVHDLATFIAGGSVTMLTRWVREDDDDVPREEVVNRLLSILPEWLIGHRKTE